MTEQTPKEKLEEAIENTDVERNLSALCRHWFDLLTQLRKAAIAYMKWAEGEMKKLREAQNND